MKKYLLDTATFLWIIFDKRKKLSSKTLKILEGSPQLFLSAVSTWEIAIKFSLGKLPLVKKNPQKWLPDTILQMGLTPLSINQSHCLQMISLPKHHNDPFDRLLISQALCENLSILSPDKLLEKYKVNVVW